MSTLKTVTASLLLAGVVLAGCGTESAPAGGATVAVPATLFTSAASPDAVSLVDAKSEAKPGDRVVFEARIGGRRAAFVENRAVFFVADSSLESCDQLPGDTCKYPWDYCCEAPADLRKHIATVQVVDDAGRPLAVSLENEHGLAPLKTIHVTGIVDQADESGNFVVRAETIYVQEG